MEVKEEATKEKGRMLCQTRNAHDTRKEKRKRSNTAPCVKHKMIVQAQQKARQAIEAEGEAPHGNGDGDVDETALQTIRQK